ncbi:MAG: DUF1446 domain-containing protein [Desulfobacter sp.]|nr:MAG: DUF1446 domain-containing protein [Desulfobacter sp.]
MGNTQQPLIIANCSGFLGDRLSAAREMVEGGPIDVLTGDYLAELTMALLFRMKMKSPDKGFALPFLRQMEEIMGPCLDKGIKVVANAGGLNPPGLAAALKEVASELGLHPRIASVDGDDLLARLPELQAAGEDFYHLDSGEKLAEAQGAPLTANAYLGGWGITRALDEGADIVVGGRIADAALVSGPCAWKFNWGPCDWDCLAGAYAAGHIIECGTQATGGNYSFMAEIPDYKNMGFPIAEVNEDGSFVITKHHGTGGRVSTGTVTAQLMYEIREPAYKTPDVTAHFDSLVLEEEGEDRVKVTGNRGTPPPDTTKVCINTFWGQKNAMTVVLTGLDIEKKAALVEDLLFESLGGKENFAQTDVQLIRSDREDPDHNDLAFAQLRITVMDPDAKKAGKFFSAKVVELALASIPGFTVTAPPGAGSPAIRHWPTLVGADKITQAVSLGGHIFEVPQALDSDLAGATPAVAPPTLPPALNFDKEKTRQMPLGRLFATRSGDKGGNANLGVWAGDDRAYGFLFNYLTCDRLKELLPDMAPYEIERYDLPNLRAVNFYIKGVLGHGVAASVRSDPQAKTLGEYLRAKIIEVPVSVL